MIGRRPAVQAATLTARRLQPPRPLSSSSSTTAGTTGTEAGASSSTSSTSSHSASSSGTTAATADALKGKCRAELAAYHPLLRTAQVAEALRLGFQEGRLPARCTASTSSSSRSESVADVEAALRASRARPSLLVPLAGSVGFGLRCLTQLLPGTAPVAKGVLGSIEEALDDGVRSLIQMETTGGDKRGAAMVKELLKARRDAVAGAATASESGGTGQGAGADPLAQGTQLVCRALLKGAERV